MTGEPTTTRNRALIGTAVAGLAVLGAFWWFGARARRRLGAMNGLSWRSTPFSPR